jgi:geranylgeranyl pyrophosphate synthase
MFYCMSCKKVHLIRTGSLSHVDAMADAAYEYGRNVGIAFQLVDDILDFESRNGRDLIDKHYLNM